MNDRPVDKSAASPATAAVMHAFQASAIIVMVLHFFVLSMPTCLEVSHHVVGETAGAANDKEG
jgi:hypothetical protein